MNVISLNKALASSKPDFYDVATFANQMKTGNLKLVKSNIKGPVLHRNYLEYLSLAWSKHYGIKLSPDIIWFTLLNEIALMVAKAPEVFRSLFSKTEDKQEILVFTEDPLEMPLHSLISKIESYVPAEIDIFLPNFTTTTDRAKTAQRAAFADALSPFYNYSMYLCGITYIDIQGTEQDWIELGVCWSKISKLFSNLKGFENQKYLESVSQTLSNIISNVASSNTAFWNSIFELIRCGSGSQVEVGGWFKSLFKNQPDVGYVRNFSTHISKVEYKNITTNKEYDMRQGLFESQIQDEFLVPEFGMLIFEKKEPEIKEEAGVKVESAWDGKFKFDIGYEELKSGPKKANVHKYKMEVR